MPDAGRAALAETFENPLPISGRVGYTGRDKISLQAGELVGVLYEALLKQYKDPGDPETLKSLNKLCVRLVVCLYAEDAGIFGGKSMFQDYLEHHRAEARQALINLLVQKGGGFDGRDKHSCRAGVHQLRNPGRIRSEPVEAPV